MDMSFYEQTLDRLFDTRGTKIIPDISPGDTMYQSWRSDHYFSVGISALEGLHLAMLSSRKEKETVKHILDFACGHGRVTRMLKAVFPNAEITACDINRDAVDYCAKSFGAVPMYAKEQIFDYGATGVYDIVWNGSLLTHLDSGLWAACLKMFSAALAPGGLAVFSMHGIGLINRLENNTHNYGLEREGQMRLLEEYNKTGFGYADYGSSPGYGVSVAKKSWVIKLIEETVPELKLVMYAEEYWDRHHDLIGLARQ